MALDRIAELSDSLLAFDEASRNAGEAWDAAQEQGQEPTLLNQQLRAVVLGLRASILLENWHRDLGSQIAPVSESEAIDQHRISGFWEAFDDEDLLTSTKAAELAGVDVKTIQRWTNQGILESTRTPGGHRRIKVGTVKRLMHPLVEVANVEPSSSSDS